MKFTGTISRRARHGIKIALVCGLLAMTAGCSGGFTLVGRLNPGTWEQSFAPREPQGPEEEAAVHAATAEKVVRNGEITAICLASSPANQIVTVVARTGRETEEMAPKKITSYLVANGKIRAHSNPVMAPSPDVDYEKTIYSAAVRALSPEGFSVIIYSRRKRDLTVKGTRKTPCTFTVTVMDGFDSRGTVLSERNVNICYDNL